MTCSRLLERTMRLSVLAMGLFLYLFISRNAPGFVHLATVTVLGVVYGIVYLLAVRRLVTALHTPPGAGSGSGSTWPTRLLLALLPCLLVYTFLESAVTDYYQPLSLFDEAIAALAAWWGLLIVAAVGLLLSRARRASLVRLAMVFPLLWALAAWPLAGALHWINQPQTSAAVLFNHHVFTGGENGYDTYRIPGLALIPAGSKLVSGERLAQDRLVAFAEARRDGALDTGVIDLVVKSSDDGGANWGEQSVICRHEQAGRRGKCGNPTPLFDAASGMLFLAYNLSGINSETRHHSGHVMQSPDGGLSWGDARLLSDDDFVFGPGKGLRKSRPPHQGRLLLPGHAGATANVIYSDDNGQTWQRGSGLAGGNESDVAELSDGRLYLATRHIAPISRAPQPNGRLYSLSADGGKTWLGTNLDTALATPVCQVSVLGINDGGGLLFTNPAHDRVRVNLSLRYSADKGKTWPLTLPIFSGPSGYSVLAQMSNGDVIVLFENGNMAYSERISVAAVRADRISLPPGRK